VAAWIIHNELHGGSFTSNIMNTSAATNASCICLYLPVFACICNNKVVQFQFNWISGLTAKVDLYTYSNNSVMSRIRWQKGIKKGIRQSHQCNCSQWLLNTGSVGNCVILTGYESSAIWVKILNPGLEIFHRLRTVRTQSKLQENYRQKRRCLSFLLLLWSRPPNHKTEWIPWWLKWVWLKTCRW
jgi:hypothetical protein